MRPSPALYVALCMSIVFVACDDEVSFPRTPTSESKAQYAVVSSHHAKVFRNSRQESDIVFPLRRGEVVDVLRSASAKGEWYFVRSGERLGWLRIQDVHVSAVQEEARLYSYWLLHGDTMYIE